MAGKRVVLERLSVISCEDSSLNTGEFKYIKPLKSLVLKTKDGFLALEKVKPEGSKSLDGAAFWNGQKITGKGAFDE